MSGKVERLHALVSVGLKNGAGISAILECAISAANNLHSSRGYDECDYHVATLLWRWGGARAAELAHKVLKLPSLRSLRNYTAIPHIRVSPSYPSTNEILENLDSVFPKSELSQSTDDFGFILMIDELAVESRLRYDAKNNMILGVCREHSQQYSFCFKSRYEADAILEGLRAEKIHFACEVWSQLTLCSCN